MGLNGYPQVHLTLVGAGEKHCEKCIHGNGDKCGNHPTAIRVTEESELRSPWEARVVRQLNGKENWLRTTDCLEAEATANLYEKIRELADELVSIDMKSKKFVPKFLELEEALDNMAGGRGQYQ